VVAVGGMMDQMDRMIALDEGNGEHGFSYGLVASRLIPILTAKL
jgi:hypothetical protein